jgi:hypothetical protein
MKISAIEISDIRGLAPVALKTKPSVSAGEAAPGEAQRGSWNEPSAHSVVARAAISLMMTALLFSGVVFAMSSGTPAESVSAPVSLLTAAL